MYIAKKALGKTDKVCLMQLHPGLFVRRTSECLKYFAELWWTACPKGLFHFIDFRIWGYSHGVLMDFGLC